MITSIIAAMDENRGIGKDGRLPWHLPDDLKRFRKLTMGHHLILGRKTFLALPKTLPGRKIIILSRDPTYQPEGFWLADRIETALKFAESKGESEVFIGGGAEVFCAGVGLADRMYWTIVHTQVETDVTFPQVDMIDWIEMESEFHAQDAAHRHTFRFKVYQRKG